MAAGAWEAGRGKGRMEIPLSGGPTARHNPKSCPQLRPPLATLARASGRSGAPFPLPSSVPLSASITAWPAPVSYPKP